MFKLIKSYFPWIDRNGICYHLLMQTLRFVSWGGAYTASQQKAYVDTWSKGSGVTVENYKRWSWRN